MNEFVSCLNRTYGHDCVTRIFSVTPVGAPDIGPLHMAQRFVVVYERDSYGRPEVRAVVIAYNSEGVLVAGSSVIASHPDYAG